MFTAEDFLAVDQAKCDLFMRDCSLPIVDWTRKCPDDDVLSRMPFRVGYWPDGATAPAITKRRLHIDTRNVNGDNCALPKLRKAEVQHCEQFLPPMREIGIETDDINWLGLRDDFCRKRKIVPGQLCIFDKNGDLIMGQEHSENFIEFAMDALVEAFATMIMDSIMVGDSANEFQFDGFYTQLKKGWPSSTNCPCPDYLNKAVEIDWAALTGGNCSPSACIQKDMTIELWGQICTAPAGMNLAQFLAWYAERVGYEWANQRGGVKQWEIHVGAMQSHCLLDAASCLRPCDSCFELFDDNVRQRFAGMRKSKVAELYPSGIKMPIFESRYVEADEMWIGPGNVGGRPTYALFFDNIDRYLDVLPAGMRGSLGLPMTGNSMLLPSQSMEIRDKFGKNTIYWDVFKKTIKCLYAGILAHVGMLVCSRHLWLHLTNVCCDGCAPNCDDDNQVIINGLPCDPKQPKPECDFNVPTPSTTGCSC